MVLAIDLWFLRAGVVLRIDRTALHVLLTICLCLLMFLKQTFFSNANLSLFCDHRVSCNRAVVDIPAIRYFIIFRFLSSIQSLPLCILQHISLMYIAFSCTYTGRVCGCGPSSDFSQFQQSFISFGYSLGNASVAAVSDATFE